MYLIKTPALVQWMMPGFVWRVPTREKKIFLSFDDGPIPEVTPGVLEMLAVFNARATFFCVGDNVRKHTGIFKEVLAAGHAVGNHTFNHLNGWKTDTHAYLENVSKCSDWLPSKLFRPPYGRLKKEQKRALMASYDIIMWDVLSGDFDKNISPEKCLRNVIDHTGPGSIVVMHDSLKTERNLFYALPRVLEHFSDKGYSFESLS